MFNCNEASQVDIDSNTPFTPGAAEQQLVPQDIVEQTLHFRFHFLQSSLRTLLSLLTEFDEYIENFVPIFAM